MFVPEASTTFSPHFPDSNGFKLPIIINDVAVVRFSPPIMNEPIIVPMRMIQELTPQAKFIPQAEAAHKAAVATVQRSHPATADNDMKTKGEKHSGSGKDPTELLTLKTIKGEMSTAMKQHSSEANKNKLEKAVAAEKSQVISKNITTNISKKQNSPPPSELPEMSLKSSKSSSPPLIHPQTAVKEQSLKNVQKKDLSKNLIVKSSDSKNLKTKEKSDSYFKTNLDAKSKPQSKELLSPRVNKSEAPKSPKSASLIKPPAKPAEPKVLHAHAPGTRPSAEPKRKSKIEVKKNSIDATTKKTIKQNTQNSAPEGQSKTATMEHKTATQRNAAIAIASNEHPKLNLLANIFTPLTLEGKKESTKPKNKNKAPVHQYKVSDLLFMVLSAQLCGAKGIDDIILTINKKKEWFKGVLGLSQAASMPSSRMIWNFLSSIDSNAYEAYLEPLLDELRSQKSNAEQKTNGLLPFLHIWETASGIIYGQPKAHIKNISDSLIASLMPMLFLKESILFACGIESHSPIASATKQKRGYSITEVDFTAYSPDQNNATTYEDLSTDLERTTINEYEIDAKKSTYLLTVEHEVFGKHLHEYAYLATSLTNPAEMLFAHFTQQLHLQNALHWMMKISPTMQHLADDNGSLVVLKMAGYAERLLAEKYTNLSNRQKMKKCMTDNDFLLSMFD